MHTTFLNAQQGKLMCNCDAGNLLHDLIFLKCAWHGGTGDGMFTTDMMNDSVVGLIQIKY